MQPVLHVPASHVSPPAQSEATLQRFPAGQRGHVPPQSTSDSSPSFEPFAHVAGAHWPATHGDPAGHETPTQERSTHDESTHTLPDWHACTAQSRG